MKTNQIALLCRFAVLCATGSDKELLALLKSKPFQNVSNKKIDEVILEVHLFAGFPAAIEGFAVLLATRKRRKRTGQSSMSIRERKTRGKEVCRRVYGEKFEALMARMELLNPEL